MSDAAYRRVTAMLDSVSWRGIKPGLERTRALLRALDDPDRGLSGVLVAGTNGKGSVCAVIESVARAAGRTTVMLTKPHLHSYTERFVVGGHAVTEARFGALMDAVGRAADTLPGGLEPTAFEMLTAAGILCAAQADPDVVVCEVGLGGRLDSTNVLDLGVAVVTNVDLDHRQMLGDTIPIIAREKAAIIKPGDAAVTAATPPALDEIRARAREVGAPLVTVGEDVAVTGATLGLGGVQVETAFGGARLAVHAPLLGRFQVDNVATAIAACDAMRRRGVRIDARSVVEGCAAVRWPGRLQWVEGSPGWLIDGAHNPAGMRELVVAVRDLLPGRRIVALFGVMQDKERGPMLEALRRLGAAGIVVTAAAVERAAQPAELAAELGGAITAADTAAGMEVAARLAGPDGAVVACGSLYLAGEVLERLGALDDG